LLFRWFPVFQWFLVFRWFAHGWADLPLLLRAREVRHPVSEAFL